MLERIAVDLGRGGDHEPRALGLGQAERFVRAERADLERRNRQLEVVDRAGRARPVQDHVDRAIHVDVVGDVVLDEHEVAAGEMRDVREIAGQQVVDADDRAVAIEKLFGQMGADEAGGSRNDDAFVCPTQICLWRTPRKSVIHMILRSSETDQFSM